MFSQLEFVLDGIKIEIHLHEVVKLLQKLVQARTCSGVSDNSVIPDYADDDDAAFKGVLEAVLEQYEEHFDLGVSLRTSRGVINRPLSLFLETLFATNMTHLIGSPWFNFYLSISQVIKQCPRQEPFCDFDDYGEFIIPKCLQNMKTVSDWIEIANYLSTSHTANALLPFHGWWASIGERLILIKNAGEAKKETKAEDNDEAEDGRFYVSDHGLTTHIISNVQQCIKAFSFNGQNATLFVKIMKFWKNFSDLSEVEKQEIETRFCLRLDDQIITDVSMLHFLLAIEGLDIWEREALITVQVKKWRSPLPQYEKKVHADIITKYKHIFKNTLEQFRYITLSFLTKYVTLAFKAGFNPFYTQLHQIMHSVDADFLIVQHVLSALSMDMNAGKHERLFRPLEAYGHRDSGAPYHKFAVTASECLKQGQSTSQLASHMRSLLQGALSASECPSFLPNLVAAWFIAEPARYKPSLVSGLMLLDLMENEVEVEGDRYLFNNTLAHPQNDAYKIDAKIRTKDFYGASVTPYRMGGSHPMAHQQSVKDAQRTLVPKQKLSIVHQKEGSIILHWLYLRCKTLHYLPVRLVTSKETPLDQQLDYSAIDFDTTKSEQTIKSCESAIRVKTQKAQLLDLLFARDVTFDALVSQHASTIKGDQLLESFVTCLQKPTPDADLVNMKHDLMKKYNIKKQVDEINNKREKIDKACVKQVIIAQLAEMIDTRMAHLNKEPLNARPRTLSQAQRPIVPQPTRTAEVFLNAVSQEYLQAMRNAERQSGEVLWGGDLELRRIAKLLNLSIIVVKNGVPQPKVGESSREIYLRLRGGHYELIIDFSIMLLGLPYVPADGNCMFEACLRSNHFLESKEVKARDPQEVVELRKQVCNMIADDLAAVSFVDDKGKTVMITETMRKQRNDIRMQFEELLYCANHKLEDCLEALPLGKLREEALSIRAYLKWKELEKRRQTLTQGGGSFSLYCLDILISEVETLKER